MASKPILVDGLKRTIGTGEDTKVWEDVWIPTEPARGALPISGLIDRGLRVHHLIDFERKEWNRDIINELIAAEDVPRILSIRISRTGRMDNYSWKHTTSGIYSVKSGYTIAVEQRKKAHGTIVLEPSCNGLKKEVWKLKAPRKIKHFLWQSLSGYVATASKLKERHCGNDTVCQRCGAETETINHILFECPPAIQSWALSTIPTFPGVFPSSSIFVNFDTLIQLQKAQTTTETSSMFPWLIWYLWKARNDKCFNNKDTPTMDTLKLAISEEEAWRLAQVIPAMEEEEEAGNGETLQEGEDNGSRGLWRCQFDASWVQDTEVGLGFVLNDGETEVIRGLSKRGNVASPLHAEAESLLWAMEELSGRGILKVCFESDCQQLVKIIQSSKKWPALDPELDAIEALKSTFTTFSLSYISRSLNLRADSLAKEARSRDLQFSFVDCKVPDQLALEASTIGPI